MAALRSGIHTVIIPDDNVSDLAEIDQTVRQSLHFVSTDHIDKILDLALVRTQTASAADYLPAPRDLNCTVRI